MPPGESLPHLQLVNPETGEVHESCPNCDEWKAQAEGAEKDIRAWRTRYANLKTDKDAEARSSPQWPLAKQLFDHWRKVCNHPRSKFTVDRFWTIEPHLREYGPDVCRRAIDGAAFDPYVTKRKNGTSKRHDDWDLIFRSTDKMEGFVNRAPTIRQQRELSEDRSAAIDGVIQHVRTLSEADQRTLVAAMDLRLNPPGGSGLPADVVASAAMVDRKDGDESTGDAS